MRQRPHPGPHSLEGGSPVPWPAAVQAPGWYPGRYVIRYEEAAAAFRISLEDFHWRDAG